MTITFEYILDKILDGLFISIGVTIGTYLTTQALIKKIEDLAERIRNNKTESK